MVAGVKLFVWANPYSVGWGSSLLVVVAEDEAEARTKAAKAKCWSSGGCFERDYFDASAEAADLGSPTRLLDIADAAEWHEWQE